MLKCIDNDPFKWVFPFLGHHFLLRVVLSAQPCCLCVEDKAKDFVCIAFQNHSPSFHAHHREAMERSAVLLWRAVEHSVEIKGEVDISEKKKSSLLGRFCVGQRLQLWSWMFQSRISLWLHQRVGLSPLMRATQGWAGGTLSFNEAEVWRVPTVVLQLARVNLVGFSDDIALSWCSCFACLLSRPVQRSADLTGFRASA